MAANTYQENNSGPGASTAPRDSSLNHHKFMNYSVSDLMNLANSRNTAAPGQPASFDMTDLGLGPGTIQDGKLYFPKGSVTDNGNHARYLTDNGQGGTGINDVQNSNGWIQDHKKELWSAAALAAGGYGLSALGAFGGAGAAAGGAASGGAGALSALEAGALPAAAGVAPMGLAGAMPAVAGGGLLSGAASGAGGLLNMQNAGAALKTAGVLQGVEALGGGGGNNGMSGPTSSSQTRTMDPYVASYIYGKDGKGGLLSDAYKNYQDNKSGMNPMMEQGLQNQWNSISDPRIRAGYNQMQQLGSGLMSAPMAGNPFTSGMRGIQSMNQPQLQYAPTGGFPNMSNGLLKTGG